MGRTLGGWPFPFIALHLLGKKLLNHSLRALGQSLMSLVTFSIYGISAGGQNRASRFVLHLAGSIDVFRGRTVYAVGSMMRWKL